MCMAIFQPKDKRITQLEIADYSSTNKDGFGFMWIAESNLCIYKTININEFIKKYEEILKIYNSTSPMVIHFRMGTSGLKNEENCHPFFVNKNLGFVHNGVIHSLGDKIYSDTFILNRDILRNINNFIMTNKETQDLFRDYVGTFNKFIFLNNKGEHYIFNEGEGEWKNGIWYSNKKSYYDQSNYQTKTCCKCHGKCYNIFYITLTGYYGRKYYICDDCIKPESKISDFMDIKKNYDDYPECY